MKTNCKSYLSIPINLHPFCCKACLIQSTDNVSCILMKQQTHLSIWNTFQRGCKNEMFAFDRFHEASKKCLPTQNPK